MVARAAVILAAGQGTRMRSPRPKVLHAVGGRTMLDRAIDAAEGAGCQRIVVVCGPHAPAVGEAVAKRLGSGAVAIQAEQKGTGHAVLSAREALAGFDGDVVVTFADTPLVDADALQPLFALREAGDDLAVLGFEAADPSAYGRLVLGPEGALERIVEAKGAPPEILAIRACNSGVLSADAATLFSLLDAVEPQAINGEYYLTDVVGLARGRGLKVGATFAGEASVMGVNSQAELSVAEGVFQARRRRELLDAGVTMSAPETVHLSHDTVIDAGATVEAYVVFGAGVRVAAGATIRAFSHLEGAHVEAGAIVGPYARLRPGARIGPDAHIGNFVEVKNVTVGQGAKANHLAYLGDGDVGAKANIGAGVIFCNYDGFDKHRTTVGEGAFVGSDVALVAPVSIGAGAYVGSGSVITKAVSPDALAVERSPQVERPGWAAAFRARKQAERAARGKS